jgi:hypothetical protein
VYTVTGKDNMHVDIIVAAEDSAGAIITKRVFFDVFAPADH